MKRYDLRHLHDNFYDRMCRLIENELKMEKLGFLFESGIFFHYRNSGGFY